MDVRRLTRWILLALVLFACWPDVGRAAPQEDMPADYQEVLSILGKQGDFKTQVLKVNIPRNDLTITVKGIVLPTPFGFGGWLALTKGEGGDDVLMGDLVLLEEEVNPVLSALLEHGLEVTALHNHFFYEEPRIFYMHVMGHGKAAELARQAKPAVDLIGKIAPRMPRRATGAAASAPDSVDTAKIAQIVGREGEQNGPVYKITIGRDDLPVAMHGAPINARMGLNTWAAFTAYDQYAAIAGDIAMLENEVPAVLRTLRQHGLEVVTIHHHMTGTEPVVIFLHYWGTGPAESLARAFKAALDQTGPK